MTETFFAIGQTGPGLSHFFGFGQHFLGQIALDELPVVFFAVKNIGQSKEYALLCTVLVQRESGDTDDVHSGIAAQDVGEDSLLIAQNAAALQVDKNLAAGQFFQLCLESPGYVADDRAFLSVFFGSGRNGVHFGIGQGDRIRQRGSAAQHQCQGKQNTKQFLHGNASLFSVSG